MMPVSTMEGGQCMAVPDPCKVPTPAGPVPTPFPNQTDTKQANPMTCSMKVMIANKPVILQNSMIPMSSGDEAGSAGGVVSGMIKGPVQFKLASVKVKIEGKGAAYVTCVTAHNGTSANAPMGAQLAPSQPKVLCSP